MTKQHGQMPSDHGNFVAPGLASQQGKEREQRDGVSTRHLFHGIRSVTSNRGVVGGEGIDQVWEKVEVVGNDLHDLVGKAIGAKITQREQIREASQPKTRPVLESIRSNGRRLSGTACWGQPARGGWAQGTRC